MRTFMFNCGPVVFLVNVQYSTIGYGYLRLFIKMPDNSYVNIDLTIGHIFGMTQKDWDSWFDKDLVNLGVFSEAKEKVCEETGMEQEKFTNLIESLLQSIWEAAETE